MKKSIVFIGAVSMALTSIVATPAVAQDGRPPASVILEFCREFIDLYPNQKIGECLGESRASDDARATKNCLYFARIGFLDAIGMTMGDCVTLFRSQE